MYAPPTAPLPIGGVLDQAIKLYRTSFRQCWPITLILSALAGAASVFLLRNLPHLVPSQAAALLALLAHAWFWFLLAGVAYAGLIGAVIASQNSLAAGRTQLTPVEAMAVSWRRLPRQVLAHLAVAAAIFIGMILMVIPGIYVWGRLPLVTVALFAEDASALRAIGSSWNLVGGHWWRTATTVTVGLIIVIVISLTFTLIGGFVLLLLRPDRAGLLLGSEAVSLLERVFLTPMMTALLVAVYHDLKLRREGGNLAARGGSLPAS